MNNTTCKNCGGEYGIHHYQTNQCPFGGREAPIGRKQEWKSTTFEANDKPQGTIAELKALIKELEKRLDEWESK